MTVICELVRDGHGVDQSVGRGGVGRRSGIFPGQLLDLLAQVFHVRDTRQGRRYSMPLLAEPACNVGLSTGKPRIEKDVEPFTRSSRRFGDGELDQPCRIRIHYSPVS